MRDECPIDNYDLYRKHEAEQEALRQLLPRCTESGHLIEDEECYNLDGEAVCEDCIPRFKVKTTYFMG